MPKVVPQTESTNLCQLIPDPSGARRLRHCRRARIRFSDRLRRRCLRRTGGCSGLFLRFRIGACPGRQFGFRVEQFRFRSRACGGAAYSGGHG